MRARVIATALHETVPRTPVHPVVREGRHDEAPDSGCIRRPRPDRHRGDERRSGAAGQVPGRQEQLCNGEGRRAVRVRAEGGDAGEAGDPNAGGCVDRANARFDGGRDPTRAAREAGDHGADDCVTFDDTASVEMLVDACVAEIVATIDPASIDQSRCGVGKKKCAAKTLKSMLKCHRRRRCSSSESERPELRPLSRQGEGQARRWQRPDERLLRKLENQAGNNCLSPLDDAAAVGGDHRQFLRGRVRRGPQTPATTTAATTTVPPPGVRQPGRLLLVPGCEGAPTATRPVRRTDAGTTARRTAMQDLRGTTRTIRPFSVPWGRWKRSARTRQLSLTASDMSKEQVPAVLKRLRLAPAPRRHGSPTTAGAALRD